MLDAFAVEDVPTFCLNSILRELVAKSANSTFSVFVLHEHAGVVLASKNKIRVARHLTHTGEPNDEISTVQVWPRTRELTS